MLEILELHTDATPNKILEDWDVCDIQCGACYYDGPIVPHNWLELPPTEWAPPYNKCPSYEFFKFKAYSPLGRSDLAATYYRDSSLQISDSLVEIFYTCFSCGMCSEICYRRRPLRVILAFRQELIKRGANIPLRLKGVLQQIGTQRRFLAGRGVRKLSPAETVGTDLLFGGCVTRLRRPEVANTVLNILRKGGLDVAFLGENEPCCGFVAAIAGDIGLFRQVAQKNLEVLLSTGAHRVIVTCSHCYKAFKVDYPQVLGSFPLNVAHIVEVVFQLLTKRQLQIEREVPLKIAYHDPCYLGRMFYQFELPRKLLGAIPGVSIVEMEHHGRWSWCCGSGGKIVRICHPKLATYVGKRRMEEAIAIGVEAIVTTCTTCYDELERTRKIIGAKITCLDFPLFVERALEVGRG